MLSKIALGLLLLTQQQAGPAKGTLEGRVLTTGTNLPVEDAEVSLIRLDGNVEEKPRGSGTGTGADGRFTFRNLEPGSYMLFVAKDGFSSQTYGARRPGFSSIWETIGNSIAEPPAEKDVASVATVLKVTAGALLRNIEVRLTMAGVISGRVTGADGKPLPGIRVRAIADVFSSRGVRLLLPADETATDDHGEFRLIESEPGRYFIFAGPSDVYLDANDPLFTKYRETTYYPGVPDFERATAVEPKPGQELRLSPFSLQAADTVFSISGTVVDERKEKNPREGAIMVTLAPRTNAGVSERDPIDAAVLASGAFHLSNVPPGSYRIRVSIFKSAELATFPVDVNASDVAGLVMKIGDPVAVAGQMEFDPDITAESRAAILRDMRIRLARAHPLFDYSRRPDPSPITPAPDATFRFTNISQDAYEISLSGLPENAYVRSVAYGADTLSDRQITVVNEASNLRISIGTHGAQVSGTIFDGTGKPLKGIRAVLIPAFDGAEPPASLYQAAYSDDSGKFTMQGIAPGDYRLMAWENTYRSYFDRQFVKPLESSVTPVHISEGSILKVDVRAFPVDP